MTVAGSRWLMVSQLCSCIPLKAGSCPKAVPTYSTPAHQAIQDCAEDAHLFRIHLRARLCLSCQPTKLHWVCSQPVFLHQLLTAARYFPLLSSLCSKPTLPPGVSRVQCLLLPLPEWSPAVVASSGRTRAGVSPVLTQDCCSWQIFCLAQRARLASAVPGQALSSGV